MRREVFDRREGRMLFGSDPAAYDMARPGHPERIYEILVDRCGLGPGADVLEIGPGTGQATRPLLELGARRLVVVEPDERLAAYLEAELGDRIEVEGAALENVPLADSSFDLAVAASAFHWIDERVGLSTVGNALRADGWWAMWWTLFGEGRGKDAFMQTIDHLFEDLEPSPSAGRAGRPAFALDVNARLTALREAGFVDLDHELLRWSASWDTAGIRALYSTFSPIQRLEKGRREAILDEVARTAERDFGGRILRTLTTSLYTARRP